MNDNTYTVEMNFLVLFFVAPALMYVLIIMATEVFRDMTLYDQSFWSYVGGCYIIFGCLAAIMTIAKLLYFMVKMLFTTNKESQNDV